MALDLTGCNTVSLFGVQGFGKSYTLGVMAEMAVRPVAGINVLPAPLATVIFHYHKSDAYAPPEFAAAVRPNTKVVEVERLLQEYGARPAALEDVMLLTPECVLRTAKGITRASKSVRSSLHPPNSVQRVGSFCWGRTEISLYIRTGSHYASSPTRAELWTALKRRFARRSCRLGLGD